MLIQALITADHAKQLAQAAHATVQEVKQDVQQVKQEVSQLQERRPPRDKLTPWGYLTTYSKPWLPADVKRLFTQRCRQLEAPERFRPAGAPYDWEYFSLPTLETAYTQATRQLSFLEAPLGWSRRREREHA